MARDHSAVALVVLLLGVLQLIPCISGFAVPTTTTTAPPPTEAAAGAGGAGGAGRSLCRGSVRRGARSFPSPRGGLGSILAREGGRGTRGRGAGGRGTSAIGATSPTNHLHHGNLHHGSSGSGSDSSIRGGDRENEHAQSHDSPGSSSWGWKGLMLTPLQRKLVTPMDHEGWTKLWMGTTDDEAEEGEEDDEDVEDDGDYYEDDVEEDGEAELDLDDPSASEEIASKESLRAASIVFRRVVWIGWWVQVITSTVSAVILLFSNAFTDRLMREQFAANGVLLAGAGMTVSFFSIFWTFSYIVQARSWLKRHNYWFKRAATARRICRSLRVGLWINLAGMALALIGAEQIVGTLVAKVLYSQGFSMGSPMINTGGAVNQFRALDMFVVQANTNTMVSLFAGICMNLYLRTKLGKYFPSLQTRRKDGELKKAAKA